MKKGVRPTKLAKSLSCWHTHQSSKGPTLQLCLVLMDTSVPSLCKPLRSACLSCMYRNLHTDAASLASTHLNRCPTDRSRELCEPGADLSAKRWFCKDGSVQAYNGSSFCAVLSRLLSWLRHEICSAFQIYTT